MSLFKNPKYLFATFLILFFVINILQSAYTGLLEDEAYYWVWSNNLAWGYFDHPPMVALFIWLGGLLFDGELGVRLLSAISFSLMIWIIWKTLDYKEKKNHIPLFFLVIVSLALMQVYGFISTPDTPLMLFTAVFFLSYKKFLENDDIMSGLWLAISMAALMYSKYHGILVIAFVVFSNLKLLKNKRFWLACVMSIFLYLPHLWWQYENGFPSFIYHLKERGHKSYHIGHSLNHFLNMIVVVGITFPVIYSAFFKKKITNLTERSYKFVVYGFFVFFFFSTFKSSPQAQWLAAMLIPLCLISFPYIAEHSNLKKWLIRLGLAQLTIILLARVWLASPVLSPLPLETHLAQTWVSKVVKATEGKPLVFINSYRNASIYQFYTGIETHSYGITSGRKSQYALLNTETTMQGKDVFGVGSQLNDKKYLATKGDRELYGLEIKSYNSFNNVHCEIDAKSLSFQSGKPTLVSFNLVNTYDKIINFEDVRVYGIFQNKKKKVLSSRELIFKDLKSISPGEIRNLKATVEIPEIEDIENMTFRVGLSFNDLPPGLQGNRVPIVYTSFKSK